MVWKTTRIVINSGLIISALLVVALLGLFIRINQSPLGLDQFIPHVKTYMTVKGYDLNLENIHLYFDGSLHIEGNNGTFSIANQKIYKKITMGNMHMVLSNRNLVLGRFIPKHIEIDNLSVPITRTEEGFEINGYALKRRTRNTGSLVGALNNPPKNPFFKNLKTIKINNIDIDFNDQVRLEKWKVTDGQVQLAKIFRSGDEISIKGIVSQEGHDTSVPVEINFSHPPLSKQAEITTVFKNADTSLLDSYLPINKFIEANGELELSVNLNENNELSTPKFSMQLGAGNVTIEKGYAFPLSFKSATIDGSFEPNTQSIYIEQMEVLDNDGMNLKLTGSIETMDTNPLVDMRLDLSPDTLKKTVRYLPDRVLKKVVPYINSHIYDAKIKNFNLSYKGYPKQLPFCEKRCGFDGSFDFENLTIKFLPRIPPGIKIKGHFVMKEDYIHISAEEGFIGNQNVKDLDVRISGYFEKAPVDRVEVKATASGELQEIIDMVGAQIKKDISVSIQGQHLSEAWIQVPLANFATDRIHLKVKGIGSNLYTTDFFENRPIKAELASINITEKLLELHADTTIDGVPTQLFWKESIPKFNKETYLRLQGDIPAKKLEEYTGENNLSGVLPTIVELQKISPEQYDFGLESVLDNAGLTINQLNWNKQLGIPLRLEARGQTSKEFEPFNMEFLSLTGEETEILGSVYYSKISNDLNLNFSKLKAGRNDFQLNRNNGLLLLTGKAMDLGSMNWKSNNSELLGDLKLRVDLERIFMKGGVFRQVRGEIENSDGKIMNAYLEGKLSNDGVVNAIAKRPNSSSPLILDFMAQDAGEAVKSLGLYKTLRGGVLTGQIRLNDLTTPIQAAGEINIKHAHAIDTPVLAQLLSLISLEELLSSEKGILFNKISVPLSYESPTLFIHKGELEGPSIGISFKGDINTDSNQMYIKGHLIPVAGLNKFISNIPIIGPILTGSQDGLVVADFKIKGPTNNPKTISNPLSVVTPGIIKDIFGFISGD